MAVPHADAWLHFMTGWAGSGQAGYAMGTASWVASSRVSGKAGDGGKYCGGCCR